MSLTKSKFYARGFLAGLCRASRSKRLAKEQESIMAKMTVVYWRDIPAQVIVKQGRTAAKRQLPERFEQAIDRCAMKVGARDTDAYLAEWRRGEAVKVEGDMEEAVAAEASRLENEFDNERIKALIANDGWAAAQA